jgi:hypothetical protein
VAGDDPLLPFEEAPEDPPRPPRLDPALGRAARDEAMAAAEAHADPDFNEAAYRAVYQTARERPQFLIDAVWTTLGGRSQTREKRAMGAVMARARRDGLIRPTGHFHASAQPQCHSRPCRIWESLIYDKFRPDEGF